MLKVVSLAKLALMQQRIAGSFTMKGFGGGGLDGIREQEDVFNFLC